MELVVDAGGSVRCIYDEALDLREIGKLQITRASHVEPDRDGYWWADMGPSGGPVLGPYGSRSEALQAERVADKRQRLIACNQRLATKGFSTPLGFIAMLLHRSAQHSPAAVAVAAAIAHRGSRQALERRCRILRRSRDKAPL
jgi:hypothetical protein